MLSAKRTKEEVVLKVSTTVPLGTRIAVLASPTAAAEITVRSRKLCYVIYTTVQLYGIVKSFNLKKKHIYESEWGPCRLREDTPKTTRVVYGEMIDPVQHQKYCTKHVRPQTAT